MDATHRKQSALQYKLTRDKIATPSLRLIPEGEKSDTFADLAHASNEGRTVKGLR